MERFITNLVTQFEKGQLGRREFCQTVAIAAAVYAAGDEALNAAPTTSGLKLLGINHISYACPDYAWMRDFYTSNFGMVDAPGKDSGERTNLMFGPEQGKGGQFLVPRNFGIGHAPASPSTVDHVCFTVSNWDDTRVNNFLRSRGLNPTSRKGSVDLLDPFGLQIQFASHEAENPFI